MSFRSQIAALGACALIVLLVNVWQRGATEARRHVHVVVSGNRFTRTVQQEPRAASQPIARGADPPTSSSPPPAAATAPVAATGTAATASAATKPATVATSSAAADTQAATTPTPPATTQQPDEACEAIPHLEFWGDVVENGDANRQPTAEACCRACRAFEPSIDVANGAQCNTYVYNPSTQACWLKYQKSDALKRADEEIQRRRRSPATGGTPWTSGVWHGQKACADCVAPSVFRGCISKDRCNTSHACGSPAIDGYAHVSSDCLESSPTAKRYLQLLESGTPLVPFHELQADYDGLGVRWGIGHNHPDWKACEAACIAHRPTSMERRRGGPFSRLPCNTWTWCSEKVCFEPDAHSHSFGNCWLKFAEDPEAPEVNMREPMLPRWLRRHRHQMPNGVPWVSGALLAPGVTMTNGTWGPRAFW